VYKYKRYQHSVYFLLLSAGKKHGALHVGDVVICIHIDIDMY